MSDEGDDRDRRRRRVPDALADGEMQLVDVFRKLLFERVRHDLLQLGPGLGGQLRLGQQHVRAGHDHAHVAPGGTLCGQLAAARSAGRKGRCRVRRRESSSLRPAGYGAISTAASRPFVRFVDQSGE